MIDLFLEQTWFAFVGATDNPKKFGSAAYRDLKKRGLTLVPVNPRHATVDGDACYPALAELPETPPAVISMVPRAQTAKIAEEAWNAGVTHIWIQMKSDTPEALSFCLDKGMNVISGECILMHVKPVQSVHAFHRWIRRLFGRMPS